MAEAAIETKIKAAIAHAADKVTSSESIEEAQQWQGIQNQQQVNLDKVRNAA